jgi:uncharacterized protein (DUF488 family)
MTIFTIGHGLLDLDRFVANLQAHEVETVVDVRSHPTSVRAPQFDKERLEEALRSKGLKYRWAGRTLGGRPPAHLTTPGGAPDYERMAAEPATAQAIEYLIELSQRERVAIMCSESLPEGCHRTRMLEPELEQRGASVEHILPSGDLVSLPTLFS